MGAKLSLYWRKINKESKNNLERIRCKETGFFKKQNPFINHKQYGHQEIFFCKYTYGMHGLNEREIWMVTLNQGEKLRCVRNVMLPKDNKDFVP